MIVYEVTCYVPPEMAKEFEDYMLRTHINDVIATGSFESATLERSSEGTFRTRYVARDQEALDGYLQHHAEKLREHFSDHMSAGIEVVRHEWTVVKHFA